nr:unnamed protein product [Callosobruchus analis]
MVQEFFEDDERRGRPVEVITEGKVALVEELVLSDRRLKDALKMEEIMTTSQGCESDMDCSDNECYEDYYNINDDSDIEQIDPGK